MTDDRHWTDNEEVLEEFVLGRVKSPVKEQLDLHLASCTRCRNRVDEELVLAAGIRQFAAQRTRAELQALVKGTGPAVPWPHVLSMAAALFMIVGIGFYNRWFLGPLPQASKLESVEENKQINDRDEDFQSSETVQQDPEQKLKAAKTLTERRENTDDPLSPKAERPVAPSGALSADVRLADKDEHTKTRSYNLIGFLAHKSADALGKEAAPAEQETAGDAGHSGTRTNRSALNRSDLKSGNLVIRLQDEDGIDGLIETPGQVRCSLEQIDTLFHLTVFLPLSDPQITHSTQVRTVLVERDSLVLVFDQTRITLEIPVEFRRMIHPTP